MLEPLVTIACITYNHVNYIRDAIEGFLMQKTNFPVEIRIFDDASNDGTQEILKEYADKHKNIILFLMTENQWSKGKYGLIDWIFPSAKGKYIALCEGDDYWTDPYKLQKQVDFLEANPDFVICFHKVKILKNGKLIKDNITNVPAEITTLGDLIKYGNYIHTLSFVFRNGIINEFPKWFYKSKIGDYPLYLLLSKFGKIKSIDEIMGVYRLHHQGIHSTKPKEYYLETMIFIFESIKTMEYFHKYNKRINSRLEHFYIKKLAYSLKKLNFSEIKSLILKLFHRNLNYFRYPIVIFKIILILFISSINYSLIKIKTIVLK